MLKVYIHRLTQFVAFYRNLNYVQWFAIITDLLLYRQCHSSKIWNWSSYPTRLVCLVDEFVINQSSWQTWKLNHHHISYLKALLSVSAQFSHVDKRKNWIENPQQSSDFVWWVDIPCLLNQPLEFLKLHLLVLG